MRKGIKILAKVLSIIVLLSIFLPLCLTLILNIGVVQNFVVQKAAEFASETLGTRVAIGHIDIDLFSRVHVDDFYVEDHERDTLLYVNHAYATLASLNISEDGLSLGKARAEDGFFKLREMSSGELNIRPIVAQLQKPNSDSNFKMFIDRIEASNVEFRYERLVKRNPEYGVDYFDMRIMAYDVVVKDFSVVKGAVALNVASLSAMERSGFKLDDLRCGLYVDRGIIRFDEFYADTPTSSLYLPNMLIEGDNWDEYKDYINRVVMRGEVRNSIVSTDDLGYFAPGMRDWKTVLYNADAKFEGVVSDLRGELYNASIGVGTSAAGTFRIKGLPDWQNSEYKVSLKHLRAEAMDINYLLDNVVKRELPERVQKIVLSAGTIKCAADFSGRLDKFSVKAKMGVAEGSASANIVMAKQEGGRYGISGGVGTSEFDLGRLLSINGLGRVTSDVTFAGSVGSAVSGGVIAVADAKIDALDFGKYRYSAITAECEAEGGHYSAKVVSDDPNMNFNLLADVKIGEALSMYGCSLDLVRADLNAVGINGRDSVSVLSANVGLEACGQGIDDMDGYVSIANAKYLYPDGELRADRIVAEMDGGSSMRSLALRSNYFDMQYQSRSSYKNIASYVKNALKSYIPMLYDESAEGGSRNYSDGYTVLDIEAHEDINELLGAIYGGLLVAPQSVAKVTLNPGNNYLSLQASSEAVEFAGALMARCNVDVINPNDSLVMWVKSSGIYMGTRSIMPNFSLTGGAQNNRVILSLGFNDNAGEQFGMLGVSAKFDRNKSTRERSVDIIVTPSHYTTRRQQWQLDPSRILIDLDSMRVDIRNLRITGPEQSLTINGVASKRRNDSLSVVLDNFDLSPISMFTSRVGYDVGARSNGSATIKSALREPEIEAQIDLDSINVNGIYAPSQKVVSNWDFEQNRARVFIIDRDSRDTAIRGYYQPKGSRYYASARMESVPMKLISPFLDGIISDVKGTARVEANVRGIGSKAVLSGRGDIDSLSIKVDYLNTHYTVPSGVVEIDSNHILANKVPVYDAEGNRGSYSMDIDLNHLSNIAYNFGIEVKDMLVMDTDSKSNDLFYGHVYASGSASFKGDKRGIKMDVEATSGNNSHFFMPLSGKEDISYAEFVRFKEPQTDSDEPMPFLTRRMLANDKRKRQSSVAGSTMDIEMNLNVLPNTEIQLVIDPTVGDVIKARGNGQLSLRIVPEAEIFTMNGDYSITEGTYLFTLQNIWNKKLTVVPGSSIRWEGDPLGAMLNINAVYTTKASLKPLLGNSMQGMEDSRSRTVNCYIKLTDQLMSPTVNFDVQVENVSSEISTILNSVLNDQQAIATQMFWLLTANTFSAEDTGAMGATLTATTGFELLSNQLSNWLSGDNYNVVFRYRPRTEFTGDEVDFGFSKSWLDNRIIVEVEGGYLSDASKQMRQNASNFVGEAFITWLIDPDGTFRFKGFTQTIDRYGENQGMQETGVGLYYSESFNTFKDLGQSLKRRFRNEKRRERRATRRAAEESATVSDLEGKPVEENTIAER